MAKRRYSSRNAADPEKLKEQKIEENHRDKQKLGDWQHVLSQPQGRRVLWGLLEHCSVFESIWSPNSSIHKNAGRQDVGHYIMAEIVRSDEDALFTMMKDNKKSFEQE